MIRITYVDSCESDLVTFLGDDFNAAFHFVVESFGLAVAEFCIFYPL